MQAAERNRHSRFAILLLRKCIYLSGSAHPGLSCSSWHWNFISPLPWPEQLSWCTAASLGMFYNCLEIPADQRKQEGGVLIPLLPSKAIYKIDAKSSKTCRSPSKLSSWLWIIDHRTVLTISCFQIFSLTRTWASIIFQACAKNRSWRPLHRNHRRIPAPPPNGTAGLWECLRARWEIAPSLSGICRLFLKLL